MRRFLLSLLFCALSSGAQVQLRDGTVLEGKVQLTDGGIILTSAGVASRTFTLDQLDRVRFADFSPPKAPAPPAPAGGLLGEYFADKALSNRLFTRIDPQIHFDWTHDTPHPLIPTAFSARWTGQVQADFSEEYTFITNTDDGVRLWLDGKLLIDDWTHHEPADNFAPVHLVAGQRYSIRMEYFNDPGQSSASLSWESPHTPRQLISPSHLRPSLENPTTRPAVSRLRLPFPSFDGGGDLTRTIDASPHHSRGMFPVIALTQPAEGSTFRAPRELLLRAIVNTAGAPITKVRFYVDETPVGESLHEPFEFSWPDPHPGHHSLAAEVVDAAGLSGVSDVVEIRIAGDGQGSFPAPWSEHTVRQRERERPTPARGHATFADGLFTLHSPPGDLVHGEVDNAHFVYASLCGDGQITAHLLRVQAADEGAAAMAGLMIRDSLRPDARRYALLAGKDRLVLSRRSDPAAAPNLDDKFNLPGRWLRLSRHGRTVRAYCSIDAKTWTLIAADSCPLGDDILLGLSLFSDDPVAPASALFDHVNITPGPPPMDSTAPGFLMRDGIFIAARITSMDDASLFYIRDGKEHRIGINEVSRIAFRPLPSESADAVSSRSGVLLDSGDFVEGELNSIRDGKARVDNVLFGRKTFDIDPGVVALFLRPPQTRDARAFFTLSDGSIYPAKRFDLEDDDIIIETPRQGEFRFNRANLLELRTLAR
jgi:hypothetical protein